jgi:hypothetical protein
VDVIATLDAPCSPDALFAVVEDLGRYPDWLDIVARAVPQGDGAWAVDLRGRLGPLAKMKRLRMVRAEHVVPTSVRFEREELDGRSHSPWRLSADVAPAGDGRSALTMHLHYGGGLFGPVLERMLGDEIERSKPRLLALVA